MTQGIIGGATSYREQSLKDITEDINKWILYTDEVYIKLLNGITDLKRKSYWDDIPVNFSILLENSLKCLNTFKYDLTLIMKAIKKNNITKKNKVTRTEVELLRRIGNTSSESDDNFGTIYHSDFGYNWKNYKDENFKILENLYGEVRTYFVTLSDAINSASRLEDYVIYLVKQKNSKLNKQKYNIIKPLYNIIYLDKEEYMIRLQNLKLSNEEAVSYIDNLKNEEIIEENTNRIYVTDQGKYLIEDYRERRIKFVLKVGTTVILFIIGIIIKLPYVVEWLS